MGQEALEKLRSLARDALASGEIDLVIGFGPAPAGGRVSPLFCRTAEDAGQLIFDGRCALNLANYLVRPEFAHAKRMALVARHADAKAAVGLVQESQLAADRVRLIAIRCGEIDGRTANVEWSVADKLLTIDEYLAAAAPQRDAERTAMQIEEVARLESLPADEQWRYWAEQFDRCIRCYACRNVCPLCYCRRCIADKNQPQWIDTSATERGNFAWNLIRAFHLAGRCIECGACERACPMDLPLMSLNRKLRQVVAEKFDYVAGYDAKVDPLLSTYDKEDHEEFIK